VNQRFSVFIVLVTMAAGLLLAGSASAIESNPCGNTSIYSGTPALKGSVWRMEVREDESAYRGPSIRDRLNHNWNDEAKENYRWTSATMSVDTGASTELMTVSAAVIGDDVPELAKGDIVDVHAVLQRIDYSKGRAPVVVRRVCGGRDEGCLDGLRKRQGGEVSGVEVKGVYSLPEYRKLSPPVAIFGCAAPVAGHRGVMAAVPH